MYVVHSIVLVVLTQLLGPSQGKSLKVREESDVDKANRLYGWQGLWYGDISGEEVTTRAPYDDRLGLIHAILHAKVENAAQEAEEIVHKGKEWIEQGGEHVAQHMGSAIRVVGHQLVNFVEKVHELEEWKKNMTEALTNIDSNELVSYYNKHYQNYYNHLFSNYFTHGKESGGDSSHSFNQKKGPASIEEFSLESEVEEEESLEKSISQE